MGFNFLQIACELREDIGKQLEDDKKYTALIEKRDTLFSKIEGGHNKAFLLLINEYAETETQLQCAWEEAFLMAGIKIGFELADILKGDKPFFENIPNLKKTSA